MPLFNRLTSLLKRSHNAVGTSATRTNSVASHEKEELDIIPGFIVSSEAELKAEYIIGLKPDQSVVASQSARKAASQCQYMLPTLLDMLSRKPHLKLLDVGCGPGSITIDLALMMPEAEVVGVDLSGAILETAKVSAERAGAHNVQFVKADVYSLPFADGTFDIVHTHQAVAHFHDHVAAIRELIRVTRKSNSDGGGGGMVCMREGDLQTARFYPESHAALEECMKTIMLVHRANGGATDAGRRLKAWTVSAGVPRERITATHSAWIYNTPEGRKEYGGHWPARCTQGAFAERAVELGVTREQLERFALAWKSWINDPDGLFAMMHGEVIAQV